MKPRPTITLPACPACSNRFYLFRPRWHLARNLSEKTGRDHFGWVACPHAQEVAKLGKFFADPEEWGLVEDAWKERAKLLLATKTASWTEAQRREFVRVLEDRHELAGATEPLPFTPAPPVNENNETKNDNGR